MTNNNTSNSNSSYTSSGASGSSMGTTGAPMGHTTGSSSMNSASGSSSANSSIGCSVHQCTNHDASVNYCTLSTVSIGTHESNPTVTQCVDCMSFVPKNK